MLPNKLKNDAIIEAICQVQFVTSEVSEVVVGRLSDDPIWKDFKRERLPVSDIPAPIRQADENLRFEPTLQLRSNEGNRLVRIGDSVIAYHVIGAYCGWANLKKELEHVFSALFDKLPDVRIKRIGFRYINSLTETRHFIQGLNSLNVQISLGEQPVAGPVNINVLQNTSDKHVTLVRIASPEFMKGTQDPELKVVIDIDVYTPPEFSTDSLGDLLDWVEDAHTYEKEAFFTLLPQGVIDKLKEE